MRGHPALSHSTEVTGPRSGTRLSPECRLVFASARLACDGSLITELLKGPLDWARVIVIAEREKATPVMWRMIESSGAGGLAIPAEAAAHLRRSSMVHDFRMLRLSARIEKTISMLHARGVPVLLLKGAALANSIYGSFTLRPMSDVDLLVRTSDVSQARDAIIESGWPETTEPMFHSLLHDQHHLPPFLDTEPTGLRVELHTMLLPPDQPFGFSSEHYWAGATAAKAPLGTALVADPHRLLLHACLHFAWSHTMHFGAWRAFRDVGALIDAPAFDWDAFIALVRGLKGASCGYWTLRLANRMSGVPVPADVLRALAPPMSTRVSDALERHFVAMIAPGEAPPCPSVKLARLLWLAALRPRWSGYAGAGRYDPENKWARARGTASTERLPERIVRHAMGIRHWWNFAWRTIVAFGLAIATARL